MATALANRASSDRALSLLKLPFSFLRSFSAASQSPSAPNPNASSSASKKPKRRKKKNLFEVAQFLPSWGLGYHMAKTHWTGVSYEITKINLYKDGRHGKAWGIVHKDGLPAADAPKKISGVHKRCWRYIPNLTKTTEIAPNLTKCAETAPKAEVQAS
ncbi:hypothetical protein F2P56_010992 [Juglans regia]|uniref:28S ribosomal protein S34, mitochondrial n=2 Tax=Juglans regia TaxID=51240 RepID=A0A833XSM6_JUGRE|nr:uncharacterized protein LOC109003776 [Juglans regia]KAF5470479.1 hypothetical protein F2P56_010992 [Juglans regia]